MVLQKNHEISLLKTFQGFFRFSWDVILTSAGRVTTQLSNQAGVVVYSVRERNSRDGASPGNSTSTQDPLGSSSSPILVPIHRCATGRLFLLVVECSHYGVFSDPQSHSRAFYFHTLTALFPASLSQSRAFSPVTLYLPLLISIPGWVAILKGLIYSLVIRASCQI